MNQHIKSPRDVGQMSSQGLDGTNNGAMDAATLALLDRWRLEDATTDVDEMRAAEEELADFKRAMNQNRSVSGERLIYP